MKRSFCTAILLYFSLSMIGQHVLQDEALQARVHFMNDAKVSYITSADVYPVIPELKQEPQIPGEIRNAFDERYQEATKVEWVVKEDRYKINFQLDGNEMFTYLDRHGNWMKSFTKLSEQDLPLQVISYLESEYPNYELTKYYLKHTPEGQSYTVAVKSSNEYVWLEFDKAGVLLNSPS